MQIKVTRLRYEGELKSRILKKSAKARQLFDSVCRLLTRGEPYRPIYR